MRKISLVLLTTIIAISLSSCEKNHTKAFVGDYTFKTSGSIELITDNTSNIINLTNKIGQLNIIDIGDNSKVMVVKDILGGEVYTYEATCNDDEIFFDPITTDKEITLASAIGTLEITSVATGKLYFDKKEKRNKIIIKEEITGHFKGSINDNETNGYIKNSDVTTVATLNKE